MDFCYEIYKFVCKLVENTFTFSVLLCLIGGIIASIILDKMDDKERTKNEAEQYSKVTNAIKDMSKKRAKYKNNVFEESTKEENNVFEE